MKFDWNEYMRLAEILHDDEGKSLHLGAAKRSAVSRAYYSSYCQARNKAAKAYGFVPSRTADDHDGVVACFAKAGLAEIASKLGDLRKTRNRCDYNDMVSNLELQAGFAIAMAKEIIAAL